MTLTFFNTGDKPASTVWNENYRHVGRCGFSTFYGMDSSGNYAAQPLGSAAQPWLSANIGTISIASDTITAVGTNAPLKLEATGTARVEIGKILSAWTFDVATTYLSSTEYQANADLFVVGYAQAFSSAGTFAASTGSVSGSLTDVQKGSTENITPICFPVKKNDYWEIRPGALVFGAYSFNTIEIGG